MTKPNSAIVRETPSTSAATLLAVAIGVTEAQAEAALGTSGGRLRALRAIPAQRIEDAGLTPKATDRLLAVMQLCERFETEKASDRTPMRGPKDVAAYFAPRVQDLEHEEFRVAVLDAQHRIKRDVLITRGLLNSSLVHPREVFAAAIAERAAAIILVHNHPSGDPTPSAEDRAVTNQLHAAGQMLDIPVHDHVIIGKGRYLSFVEAGLL